jgi:hypothetical protein
VALRRKQQRGPGANTSDAGTGGATLFTAVRSVLAGAMVRTERPDGQCSRQAEQAYFNAVSLPNGNGRSCRSSAITSTGTGGSRTEARRRLEFTTGKVAWQSESVVGVIVAAGGMVFFGALSARTQRRHSVG